MKRLSLLSLLFFFSFTIMAEVFSDKHELEIVFGEPSALWLTQCIYHCGCGPQDADVIYEYRGLKLLPSVNFKYHYNYSRVFAMGAIVGYNLYYTDWEASGKILQQWDNNLYTMFSMRFNWRHKENLICYSGIAIGVGLEVYNKDHRPIDEFRYLPLPALQLTFVGFKVGSGKLYWTAEIGYGNLGFFNTGIGFRL